MTYLIITNDREYLTFNTKKAQQAKKEELMVSGEGWHSAYSDQKVVTALLASKP